jgi:hypothetical protein
VKVKVRVIGIARGEFGIGHMDALIGLTFGNFGVKNSLALNSDRLAA